MHEDSVAGGFGSTPSVDDEGGRSDSVLDAEIINHFSYAKPAAKLSVPYCLNNGGCPRDVDIS